MVDDARAEGWDACLAAIKKLVSPYIVAMLPPNPWKEEGNEDSD